MNTRVATRRLSGALRMPPSEWLLLGQLVVLAAVLAVALRIARVETVVRVLRRASDARLPRGLPAGHRAVDRARLARLADVAARLTSGRERCLPRSLMLAWLLWARGESARLCLGAARGFEGGLAAHAWVEDRLGPLADSPSRTRRYATFLRFSR